MRIDGVRIGHRGQELAWAFLAKLTQSQLCQREVGVEQFIQGTVGPGCFEITPSFMGYKPSDTFVIHDTDQEGALVFIDPRSGARHIAWRPLYQAAEAIRPDRYLFEDWNNPGTVFQGTRADFDRLQAEGYNPQVFHGPVSPDQSQACVNWETENEEWVNVITL